MATLDKVDLDFFMGRLADRWMGLIDAGLRVALELPEELTS
jgi:hypothetical protein